MRKNLIATRQALELTQVEMSKKLKISERHYQRLESGVTNGSLIIWSRISEILNQSIDILIKDYNIISK